MLDLRLFRNASFSAVRGVAAVSVFGLVGVALLSVLYMERVGQTGPLGVGVRLLPLFATFLLGTVVAARVLVRRVGLTPLITAGLLLIGAGSLALLAADASGGYGAMCPGLLIAGIGAGLLTAPSTAAANSAPPGAGGHGGGSGEHGTSAGHGARPQRARNDRHQSLPRNLHDRLVEARIPSPRADRIVEGASHGRGATDLPASLARAVGTAVPRAFTDAVHLGNVIGGVVLIVMAVPAAMVCPPEGSRSPDIR